MATRRSWIPLGKGSSTAREDGRDVLFSPPWCLHCGDSARKLVSRIVLTTSAPSPRCCRVVMMEAAHRLCCFGGGADPHQCVRRWGVVRSGQAGAPIKPGQAAGDEPARALRCAGHRWRGKELALFLVGSSRPGHRRSQRSHLWWGREAAQAITHRASFQKCWGVIR